MSVEDRVRDGLRAQAEGTDVRLPPVDDVFARAERQRTKAGAAVISAVLIVAAGIVVAMSAKQTPTVEFFDESEPDGDVPALDPDVLEQHSWGELPPGPLDQQADVTMVWTGAEVVLWNGEVGAQSGAAYRPETATWHELPDAPLRTGGSHAAVWTGKEMIVWGGNDATAQAAAYDPMTDQWRVTAEAPIPATALPAVVWTGEEMIVWGGTKGGGSIQDEAPGAAYDPETDNWRALPSAPVAGRRHATAVWTGEEMIVWGGQQANNPPVTNGAAYDPEDDSWRELPPAPVTGFFRHSAAWTGDEMLVWGWVHGTTGQENETVAYDPAGDEWRELSPAPLDPPRPGEWVGGQSAVWVGSMLLAWSGTLDEDGPLALAFDPNADQWTRLAQAPTPAWYHPQVVWTGSGLVVWGGGGDDLGSPPLGGAELRFGGEAGPDASGNVPVPDVQGLTLAEAEDRLRAVGLTGGPVSGAGWEDPDEAEAVVVNQEPPPGTIVARGDAVGFRTALVNSELCGVFIQLSPRQGDAHDLARTEGYWDMLSEARAFTDPRLAGYIDDLLDHHETGDPVEEAPTRPLESVTIHHDACHQGGGWRVHETEADGLAVEVPPGWHVAEQTQTPNLSDPVEVLTVATVPLSGSSASRCAHQPGAVELLGPGDALLTVQERSTITAGVPPRPRIIDAFEYGNRDPVSTECFTNAGDIVHERIDFQDAGRAFHVYATYGAAPANELRQTVLRIVNSLTFSSR